MGSVPCPSILHPQKTILQVRLLENKDEACKIARELHTATHLSGHALWKLFRDRYTHKAGRRICLETAQSCPQCQLGTDYGQKTTGTIQSQGPSDMLSIDIVGPIPPDHRHEFLIVFVDCYSKYIILIPSSNHTANTVSEALMRCYPVFWHSPQAPLRPRPRVHQCHMDQAPVLARNSTGSHFTLPSGGQRHQRKEPRTLNNMLRARLLEGPSAKAWVDKVPGIMLSPSTLCLMNPTGFLPQ